MDNSTIALITRLRISTEDAGHGMASFLCTQESDRLILPSVFVPTCMPGIVNVVGSIEQCRLTDGTLRIFMADACILMAYSGS